MASTCLVSRWERVRFTSLALRAQGVSVACRASNAVGGVRLPVSAPRTASSSRWLLAANQDEVGAAPTRYSNALAARRDERPASTWEGAGSTPAKRAMIAMPDGWARASEARCVGSTPTAIAMFSSSNGKGTALRTREWWFDSIRERHAVDCWRRSAFHMRAVAVRFRSTAPCT